MICIKRTLFLVCCIMCLLNTQCEEDTPRVISRQEWNATAPKSQLKLSINPPPYVVVHHSAMKFCSTEEECKEEVKNIQNFHMITRGWEDIGYNFLIGGDGNIYEGRGWGIHGAHVVKFNARSIGICLLGNFEESQPPDIQLKVLSKLISYAKRTQKISENYRVIGHRQGTNTLCPGQFLYKLVEHMNEFDPSPK